jgi:hypothetical protein
MDLRQLVTHQGSGVGIRVKRKAALECRTGENTHGENSS